MRRGWASRVLAIGRFSWQGVVIGEGRRGRRRLLLTKTKSMPFMVVPGAGDREVQECAHRSRRSLAFASDGGRAVDAVLRRLRLLHHQPFLLAS